MGDITISMPRGNIYYQRFLEEMLKKSAPKPKRTVPPIKKVIFNPPATIVIWSDDTKTVVKAENEVFDPEKGLAMAITKRALGGKGNYFNEIKKWTETYVEPDSVKQDSDNHALRKKIEEAKDMLIDGVNNIRITKRELRVLMLNVLDMISEDTKNG